MLIDRTEAKRDVTLLVLVLVLLELIRTAWLSDDAAITLRCVLNLLHGYGPTFNIQERVQAFTHPLWFLLLSLCSCMTKNIFFSVFTCSMVCSLLVVWLYMTRVACCYWSGLIGASVLILSKAYVDFSTSGLENPLAHVLLLVSVLTRCAYASLRYFFLSLSAVYLTRPDLVVLFVPLTLYLVYVHRREALTIGVDGLIGFAPVILWTLFSLFYYGVPFPNTAYAKLATGIPLQALSQQGVFYLLDSLSRDPLTLLFICLSVALGLSTSAFEGALAIGILLDFIYVVCIGGDFMSGRFLTAPLLLAVVLFTRSKLDNSSLAVIAFAVGALGVNGLHSTLLSSSRYSVPFISTHGIADERGYYYLKWGLLSAPKHSFIQPNWAYRKQKNAIFCGGLGAAGLASGPGAHLIDQCALADPLLARLPVADNSHVRIGHFVRKIPAGYEESIAKNANYLNDPVIKDYYESIRVVTRGAIWDLSRLKHLIKINLGLHSTKTPHQLRARSVAVGHQPQSVDHSW